ncbi:hypothetical protein BJX61DRAFT_495837 [Aspergillus egyptiacus]|nr:hypothetical protein BJX61DRAFT_495837 [Aspergillus egyptiacus]
MLSCSYLCRLRDPPFNWNFFLHSHETESISSNPSGPFNGFDSVQIRWWGYVMITLPVTLGKGHVFSGVGKDQWKERRRRSSLYVLF